MLITGFKEVSIWLGQSLGLERLWAGFDSIIGQLEIPMFFPPLCLSNTSRFR